MFVAKTKILEFDIFFCATQILVIFAPYLITKIIGVSLLKHIALFGVGISPT